MLFRSLKVSEHHSSLLDSILDTWTRLFFTDQIFLVEAVEQMLVNIQLSSSLIKSLQNAATTSQSSNNPPGNPVHALIFVGTKLLSLYSTKRANQLTSEDILFLIILCQSTRRKRKRISGEKRVGGSASTSTASSSTRGTRRIFKTTPHEDFNHESKRNPETINDCDSSDYEMLEDDSYFDESSPSPGNS